jgi:hypothetical protein
LIREVPGELAILLDEDDGALRRRDGDVDGSDARNGNRLCTGARTAALRGLGAGGRAWAFRSELELVRSHELLLGERSKQDVARTRRTGAAYSTAVIASAHRASHACGASWRVDRSRLRRVEAPHECDVNVFDRLRFRPIA